MYECRNTRELRSCHQDNYMFVPLLERHAHINPSISHSASLSSSMANSFPSGDTETDSDQLSGEFARALVNKGF
ncbi:hypothetical protein F7725_022986 [Dissostichus mawsoni]|uniref:Uncharacterized protein n=1 Tax=Dissostichus mawsoni TaxID=36200 RepID=A0A7J5Z1D5_DISMA|nr:hypothetical protein F7725_022986 [Dissostichus mawsoni]